MLPNLSRKAENELDTRLTPRVINRFRLRALHDCKIRCRLQESLPLAPTTERLPLWVSVQSLGLSWALSL